VPDHNLEAVIPVVTRREEVRVTADVSNFVTRFAAASAAAGGFAGSLEKADNNMGGLVQTGLALGPALVPIASAAVPVIAGLATQLGFAAIAAGTTALAFNGVGGALTALNKYRLEPTTANFVALQNAMAELSPAGEDFVRFLHKAGGDLHHLQGIAQAGMFPGVEKGITSLLALLPKVEAVVSTVSTTLGGLVAEGGKNLNSPEWVKFFDYLNTTAAPTLTEMGRTFGNVVTGIASMTMAFDPLSRSFSTGLLDMSRSFADWSANLDQSQGFQDFVSYIQTNGPAALDALGSIVNALAKLVEAAAPVGSATLPIITKLVDALAAVAGSPAGPALVELAVGVATLSKAMTLLRFGGATTALTNLGVSATTSATAMRGLRTAGLGLFAIEGLVVVATTIGDSFMAAYPGVETLTKSLLRLETAGKGAELAKKYHDIGDSIRYIADPALGEQVQQTILSVISLGTATGFNVKQAKKEVDSLDASFAKIATDGGPKRAANVFADFAAITGMTAVQQKKLLALMPQYREALAGAANTATFAAGATGNLTTADAAGARAARLHAAATLKLVDAMRTQRSEAIGDANAEIAYQQSIDDARKALAANGKTLDITTDKGRANRTALLNMAGAWNAQSTAAKNTIGAHHAAIVEFVKAATQMGMNADKAKAYARQLFEIPTRHATVITVDTGRARNDIAAIQRQVNALYGKTIVIRTQHMDVRLGATRATGGLLRGPGTGTSDSIPVWASDGEYWMRAAAVEKYGVNMFDRLNAMTYAGGGLVQRHFAGGGQVQRNAPTAAEVQAAKDAAAALAAIRQFAKDYRAALAGFHVGGNMDTSQVRDEIRQFTKAIHDAGGVTSDRFKMLSDRLLTTARRLDDQRKALDDSVSSLHDLRSAARDFRSTVASNFQTDIFGNGLAGADTMLAANRNDARKFHHATDRAEKLGLHGAALRALLASGDLATASEMNTRAEVQRFQRLYASRAQAVGSLARDASADVFGHQLDHQTRELAHLRKTVDRLNDRLGHLGKDVHDGAKDGVGGRNREAHQRRRAGV
jgi:hypothetical protein